MYVGKQILTQIPMNIDEVGTAVFTKPQTIAQLRVLQVVMGEESQAKHVTHVMVQGVFVHVYAKSQLRVCGYCRIMSSIRCHNSSQI